jgi:deoxycytidine triphosphate deaminase
MTIQSDRWIREQALATGMIEPFTESQRRDGCISYGLSSYGYDARVADEFKIFTNVNSSVVDPKLFDPDSFVDKKTDCCIIPPNSFALARTVGIFPDPPRHPRHLPRQIDLRSVWYHRECHATGAGLGRACHPRIFEHDPTTCQNLCE